MKRFLGLLLALLLILPVLGMKTEAANYGQCGENLTWRFESDTGTLVISGIGAMYSYRVSTDTDPYGNPPWKNLPVTSVRIGENVTALGPYAFWGLGELTEFTVPEGFTSIPNGTFGYCSSLTKVVIPESVKSIGSMAFEGCTSLTSFVVPDGDTAIGYATFSGCSALQSITIPTSVTSIGDDAFFGCDSLTDVYYDGSGADWDKITIGGWNEPLINAAKHYVGVSAPVAAVLESVTTDAPVISWTEVPGAEGYAVYRSQYQYNNFQCIATLTETTYTDHEAVVSSNNYYKVSAYDADTDTYSEASNVVKCFRKMARPTDNVCGDDLTWSFDEATGLLTVTGSGDMHDYIVYDENYKHISVAPWGELPVKAVSLPLGLTSIGEGAFRDCVGLTEVTIPATVTRLGEYAFSGCTGLKEVILPDSVVDLSGQWVFQGCSSLEYVRIPDHIEFMGISFFAGCTALEEIRLPSALKRMDGAGFNGCTALKRIEIPESVVSLGSSAFQKCSSLTEIRIPESMSYIDMYTFRYCTNLKRIHLPVTVTKINESAFYACDSLTDIWYQGNPEMKAQITISGGNLELKNAVWHYVYSDALPAPQIVVENNDTGGLNVRWESIPDSVGFEVAVATSPDGEFRVMAPTSTGRVGSYVIFRYNKLDLGVAYYFRARALDAEAKAGSDWSNVASGYRKLKINAPSVQQSCNGENIISWKAVENAVGYELWRAPTAEPDNCKKLITTTELSCTDSNADQKTSYNYQVVALHEDPNSNSEPSEKIAAYASKRPPHSYSEWVLVSEPSLGLAGEERRECIACGSVETRQLEVLVPKAPVVKISGNADTGKPKLSWKAVAGADLYRIYRAAGTSGSYSYYKSTRSTEFTDTGAKVGTNYFYKVLARSEKTSQNSKYSNVVNRVCDLTRPVMKLKVDTASGKPKITFEKVSGAEKYYIVRSTSKSGTYSKVATVSGTSYIDKTAKAGTNYYYKVKALHAKDAADSAYSEVTNRVCDLAKPVVSITLKSGDPRILWETVAGAEKYYVYRSASKDGTYTQVYTAKTARSYTDSSAKSGKTYYYKVMAVHSNSAANSAYSSVKSITTK